MAQDLQSELQRLQNEYDLLKALEEFRSQQLKDANSTNAELKQEIERLKRENEKLLEANGGLLEDSVRMKVYRDKTIPQLNLNFNAQLSNKTQEAYDAKEKLRETEEKLRETEAKLLSEQAKRLKHYRNEEHKTANEAANAVMPPVKHEIVHCLSPVASVVLRQEGTDNDSVHSSTPADTEDYSNEDRRGSAQRSADIKVNVTEMAAPSEQCDVEPFNEEMMADASHPLSTHPSVRRETEVDREESQDAKRSAVHEEDELPFTQEPTIWSTTSAQGPSTSGIVFPKRGRGRPRKDDQPSKCTDKTRSSRKASTNPRKHRSDASSRAPSRGPSRHSLRQIPSTHPTKASTAKGRQADEEQLTYCLCERYAFDDNMIQCPDKRCPIGWFHYKCVNIKARPPKRWYCPRCRGVKSTLTKSSLQEKS